MTWTQAGGSPWPRDELSLSHGPALPGRVGGWAEHDGAGTLCRTCGEPLRYDGARVLPCGSDVCAALRADRERGAAVRRQVAGEPGVNDG